MVAFFRPVAGILLYVVFGCLVFVWAALFWIGIPFPRVWYGTWDLMDKWERLAQCYILGVK